MFVRENPYPSLTPITLNLYYSSEILGMESRITIEIEKIEKNELVNSNPRVPFVLQESHFVNEIPVL